jgi:UDP-N-acetyl-D-mannosaminuronic acid transferase (WecB/TagA/CpsF family)
MAASHVLYMLAENEEETKLARVNIKQLYPNLNIVSSRSRYFTNNENQKIIHGVNTLKTDALWVESAEPNKHFGLT